MKFAVTLFGMSVERFVLSKEFRENYMKKWAGKNQNGKTTFGKRSVVFAKINSLCLCEPAELSDINSFI